jgi:GNAT superfamily N-acetyltransferase
MNRMLMASGTMAARIERAECDTVVAFAAEQQASGTDVMIHEIGSAYAIFAGPGQPINKLAGLGFAPLDEDALAQVERAYDARNAELRVELATLADPSVGLLLTRRGYELAGYENVLGLALGADLVDSLAVARESDLARGVIVTRAGADETRPWIETVADGFSHPDRFDGPPPPTESFDRDQIVEVFLASSNVEGMALYLARRDGTIAGGGSTRISKRLVQLSGAATLPAHRRRGVQSALMRARLLDAAREGCDLAIVTTEPGSKSQENVQRVGFALLYARAVLIRRPKA